MPKLIHPLAIFLGAFLLFLIQPLMGKFLLPWFGGGPGVWTTCLLFFQTLLLGGYAYAHWLTTSRSLRRQAGLHLALLVIALALLPVIPRPGWQPEPDADPVGGILVLLLANVGLPYLLLSATGPLFQHWFTRMNEGAVPYRLYALSNAGSLLALVSFPFLFEPWFSRVALGWAWSAGFVAFTGLCAVNFLQLRRAAGPTPTVTSQTSDEPEPSQSDRILWLALPAVASLLLAATTNKLCLEIAAMPFLWVLPLGVYLLSFILCFDHPRWYSRFGWSALFAAGCGACAHCLVNTSVPLLWQVTIHSLTLLAACMICHGELHRLKPAPRGLTGYYLTIAAGGALGTGFVALLAPVLFDDYRELPLGLVLAALLAGLCALRERNRALSAGTAAGLFLATFIIPALTAEENAGLSGWLEDFPGEILSFYTRFGPAIGAVVVVCYFSLRRPRSFETGPGPRVGVIPLLFSALLGIVFLSQAGAARTDLHAAGRNFYGAYKLHLYGEKDSISRYYLLSHGGTTHGVQLLDPTYAAWPTTYYGRTSGVGRALDSLDGPRRIGLIGLGAGTMASYGRSGDVFRFYEIDPAIVEVARQHFSYLDQSPAKIEVVLGDARLSLKAELQSGHAQRFDLLVLDAFSGDAIPVHLLTREAMAIYRQHLRPGGVIAVHISNRYLDLQPVVETLARENDLHFATVSDKVPSTQWWLYNTKWVILTDDPDLLYENDILSNAEEPAAPDQAVHWTDDHASLFSVLR